MKKTGIRIDIPGFGILEIQRIVSDYTGTLSCGGVLVPGLKELLIKLSEQVDIVVVTSDTFGTAEAQLAGIAKPYFLKSAHHDQEKQQYVRQFDLSCIAAFGNGNNDRWLLRAVKEGGGLAIAVDNGEGCATEALQNAHLLVHGAVNAFSLLLEPNRCKATLRL